MELKLTYVDDKSDAVEAAAAVEKLVKVEGLKVILSTQVSPINLAAGSAAEKYGAYYHAVVTWTNAARDQKYKWVTDFFFAPGKLGKCPSRWWSSSLKPTGPPSGAS